MVRRQRPQSAPSYRGKSNPAPHINGRGNNAGRPSSGHTVRAHNNYSQLPFGVPPKRDWRNAACITEILGRWWSSVRLKPGCAVLGLEDYCTFYLRMLRVFRETRSTAAQLARAVRADWMKDSHGGEGMGEQDFTDSIFQLALNWERKVGHITLEVSNNETAA